MRTKKQIQKRLDEIDDELSKIQDRFDKGEEDDDDCDNMAHLETERDTLEWVLKK